MKEGQRVIIKKTGETGFIEEVNHNPYVTFLVSSYRVKLDKPRTDGYTFTICSRKELKHQQQKE